MKTKTKILLILSLIFLPLINLNAQTTGGELIKGESFNAVYYKSTDGKRYVFPNQRIYNSWYKDFSTVKTIPDEELFQIPLGGNVFYKPNSRLVKITTNPKVYWVDKNGLLRYVPSEAVARILFGENWTEQVDDLPDEFFTGYSVGDSINQNFDITIELDWDINKNKNYRYQEQNQNSDFGNELNQEQEQKNNNFDDQNQTNQLDNINLTVYLDNNVPNFKWSTGNNNIQNGFRLMKSTSKNFTAPGDYHVDLDSSTNNYTWIGTPGDDDAYYKICILDDTGKCKKYSDEESLAIGSTDKNFKINLDGEIQNGIVKLSWKREWLNAKNGYYLMRSRNQNPEFATSLKFSLSKELETYNWEGISPGIYHFRICNYTGTIQNGCEYYSNDLELIIE